MLRTPTWAVPVSLMGLASVLATARAVEGQNFTIDPQGRQVPFGPRVHLLPPAGLGELCPASRWEFSLDLGSDTEWSDLGQPDNGGFDAGDIYYSTGGDVTPPTVPCGRNGEIDDADLLGTADPNPVSGNCATPRWLNGGISNGGCGPAELCWGGTFDLDDHDRIDINLSLYIDPEFPLNAPLTNLDIQSVCLHRVEYLRFSYDDDQAPSWAEVDYPSEDTSATGATYGSTAGKDEVLELTLTPSLFGTFNVAAVTPWLSETEVHPSLADNPDFPQAGQHHDDDVDGLDINVEEVGGSTPCEYVLFSVDHEANAYIDNRIYLWHPLDGVVLWISPATHLGIYDDPNTPFVIEEPDVAGLELAWIHESEGNIDYLTLLFTVHPDDPASTGIDESGGLDPTMIYASHMGGYYWPLLNAPLSDNVDAISVWCTSATDIIPPQVTTVASLAIHENNGGIWGIDFVAEGSGLTVDVEPRSDRPPVVYNSPETIYAGFSEIVRAADGNPDSSEITMSAGVVDGFIIFDPDWGEGLQSNIGISQMPDQTCLSLSFSGIEDLVGNSLAMPVTYYLVLLQADVNADRVVDSLDTDLIKAESTRPITYGNFRMDVNLDGWHDAADIVRAKCRNGRSAPNCPEILATVQGQP